ncbi:hypothetical protein [Pseudoalteromonas ostreae]|uniref:hypothetical protein n=1 Tax=Pseudoalteromonas ostreae TaxID=2774154 RepID=UPI001B36505D|nr:hypothetical protein [Pseudoalteromonas ostreae]
MCILYKQQMQQYSDNTSSRSYRNAAKDYKNNCSNPPPATQAQPVPVVVAPETHDDDKVKSVLETQSSTVNPLDSNPSVAKSDPVEVQREASVIVENVENVESTQVEQNSNAVITVEQPLGQNNDVVDVTPEAVITSEPVTIKVTAPELVRTEPVSLLMPSLLLLVVLLLAAMLLLRLRANKKAAVETAPIIPIADEASSTEAAVSKLGSVRVGAAVSEPTVTPKKAVIAEQAVIATSQTEVINSDDVNVKVELTQRLFKNEHDFKEPEVRIFDPDAPLPGQKPQQLKEAIQPATLNAEADLATNLEPQQTTTAVLNSEAVADSAQSIVNPFANLSLDPSWDPNSKEKPTIAPKKTVPKSAKLIAAQERAKQLKTDD